MGAVGFTSGDPQKVDVAGDTMTGTLTIAAPNDLVVGDDGTFLGDLGVTGLITGNTASIGSITSSSINTTSATVTGVLTDSFQGVTGDVTRLIASTLSTGIESGGSISINADPTKIDIAATTGWIIDFNPTATLSATNPLITYVNFAGSTGLTPSFPFTFWLITSAGAVIQQATIPTRTQFRTHLFLGACGVVGGVVQGFSNLPYLQGQTGVQVTDLMRALAPFNIDVRGNLLSANGANLMINSTGGPIFARAFNLPNYQDPHVATLAAQAPVSFHRMTGTALLPALVTTIDVANYDPGGLGVVTPIGGGANTTTIHRVYGTGAPNVNDQITVQYGQNTYATLAGAVAAIGTGVFTPNFTTAGAALLGWIAAIRTATDLSNPTQATFTHAGRFSAP